MKIIATLTGICLFCATAAQASPAIHLETTLSATNPISITLRQNLDSQKPSLVGEIKTPHHYSFSEYETTNNKSDGFTLNYSGLNNLDIMGRSGNPGSFDQQKLQDFLENLENITDEASQKAKEAYQRSYIISSYMEYIQSQHAVSGPDPENQEINFAEVFPYFGINNSAFLAAIPTMRGNPEEQEHFGQNDEIHVERARYLCNEFGFKDLELSKCIQREFHRSERRQMRIFYRNREVNSESPLEIR